MNQLYLEFSTTNQYQLGMIADGVIQQNSNSKKKTAVITELNQLNKL